MSKEEDRWSQIDPPDQRTSRRRRRRERLPVLVPEEQPEEETNPLPEQPRYVPREVISQDSWWQRIPLPEIGLVLLGLPLVAVAIAASIKTVEFLWTTPHGQVASIGLMVILALGLLFRDELF